MMNGVLLETCCTFIKRWNNKFYYKVACCWLFLLVVVLLFYFWQQIHIELHIMHELFTTDLSDITN